MTLSFHWYGFIIGIAILASLWVSTRVSVYFFRYQRGAGDLEASFWWVIVSGILGARTYHVVDEWAYYAQNLQEIMYLWQGGLGIYGAILGGLLGLFGYFRLSGLSQKNLRFLSVLDLIAFGLPIGQAIGRIGNYINHEVYGLPTQVWWKIYIPLERRLPGFLHESFYHPLFLYESLWCLAGFLILCFCASKKLFDFGKADYFIVYVGWYAVGRILLEPLRLYSWGAYGIPVANWVGLAILFAILLLYTRRYFKK